MPRPLSELLEDVRRSKARVEQLVALGPAPSKWPRRGGGTLVVSLDASKPGRWRVTSIDAEQEPVGHIEAATHADALTVAWRLGAILD